MNQAVNSNAGIALAVERYRQLALQECFDATSLDSRPNATQLEIFQDIGKVPYRWVVAGNQSGKSSLAAREIAWILTDTHPFWIKPATWGTEPLLILIAGQDRKMMEIELWGKKIAPFLDLNEWREVRAGQTLQYAEHRPTGNKVVFISHSDSSEKNRKHMQGYVAHYVWLDEMPSSIKILEELQRRVDSRRGYFLATFTPKFRSDEIKKVVDSAKMPIAKKYQMSKLDNPLYADRLQEEIDKLVGYPEAQVRSILYGDWYVGDSSVYFFNEDFMVEQPDGYSPSWRHVESSDPAIESQFGFTLWAEQPGTGVWYLVKADYIEGIAVPEDIVGEVKKRTEGYNLVRRISDYAPWYTNTAAVVGMNYLNPFNKNNRKDELIKGLQSALSDGTIKIAPWCKEWISEIQTCQWSESGAGRIVNSSIYHLLDSSQYFVDCKPRSDVIGPIKPWHQELREANDKRKKEERVTKVMQKIGRRSRWTSSSGSFRRL